MARDTVYPKPLAGPDRFYCKLSIFWIQWNGILKNENTCNAFDNKFSLSQPYIINYGYWDIKPS